MSRLTFSPLRNHEPGTLHRMLLESYRELLEEFPDRWEPERENWGRFDRETYETPDTIGAAVFVSMCGTEPVGFGSFDPRELPARGIVGHNCILPRFRRHGYGSRQLEEIVRRLRVRGARTVAATSNEHPFFLPARRMYLSFGFEETGRREGGPDPDWRLVDYLLAPEPEA